MERGDSSVLSSWLRPATIDRFRATVLGRSAWARPAVGAELIRLLDWPALGRCLQTEPSPDTIVVAQGSLLDLAAPRSLHDARELLRRGIGLNVRHAERHDSALADLAGRFARDLGGKAQIQLFVTAAK